MKRSGRPSQYSPACLVNGRGFLPLLALVLAGTTGCYHVTGFQRPSNIAEEIPEKGGDRVSGLKAAAGPGDYFLGNDNLGLAIDGTPFGEPEGSTIAGAVSGGSIVDVGTILLDQNFKRVNLPTDFLERLTPVVNQDPELPLVFSTFLPVNREDGSEVVMQGWVYDPGHRISGATWDAQHRVKGVTVNHRIRLGSVDNHFLLETTLTNGSGASVGIRNLGDALIQQGGGYRFNVPARENAAGQPIANWGVEIPGSDFSQPLNTSVKAPMVALMAPETAGSSYDSHASLGIMSDKDEMLLVASDPQAALTENRPRFSRRLVVGSPAAGSALAPGATLTFRRRLFVSGGTSSSNPLVVQATGVFNLMVEARLKDAGASAGLVTFTTYGSADPFGSMPSEIRIERNEGSASAPDWRLARTEWWETPDNPGLARSMGTPSIRALLAPGTYRMKLTNRTGRSLVEERFYDVEPFNNRSLELLPLQVESGKHFSVGSASLLCPERELITGPNGNLVTSIEGTLYLQSRANDVAMGVFQPGRFTVVGTDGTPNPDVRRGKALSGAFDIYTQSKSSSETYLGAFHFRGGNTVFGARFAHQAEIPLQNGNYRVFSTHGPLSFLDTQDVKITPFKPSAGHVLVGFEGAVPTGWVAFDVPGPSMATTGGFHPVEKLSSAIAEAVNVVGFVEQDAYVDGRQTRDEFRVEVDNYAVSDEEKLPLGADPIVAPGRSSLLVATPGQPGVIEATTLFTPTPNPARRRGGARLSTGWTLADFLAQGGGSFTVLHQPRAAGRGLFALKNFDPAVKLGQGVNEWWTRTSPLSLGRTMGSFDALELLRSEGFNPANPTLWFEEFKQLRADWFAILNQQVPTAFTKALGLSSARFSQDTTVGSARTYVKAADMTQDKLEDLQKALRSGACVASTGPFLDASLGTVGLGGTASGSSQTLNVTVYAPYWLPVDEVRVVVNGVVVKTLTLSQFTQDAKDSRKFTASLPLSFATTADAWVVVEAGVPLTTTGAYAPGSAWSHVMKGIYPIAVTNPIFVDTNGGGYKAVWN